MISAQQAAYSIAGVDPSQPCQAVLRRGKKRPCPCSSMITQTQTQRTEEKLPPSKKPKPITSLYITGLPLDATPDEIARVFSRYGVLLEDDQGKPRVKMYYDEKTEMFKGEALVVYFKPESVELAINMLDETSLRGAIGQNTKGPMMRVQRAEFPTTNTTSNNTEAKQQNRVSSSLEKAKDVTTSGQKRNLTDQDRKKIAKRVAKLENKLSDWRDSPSPPNSPTHLSSSPILPPASTSGGGRTVVLTKMFTLHELDSDPSLLLDLKQDVREECNSRIGGVTNVILYDKEPEGIITVKFKKQEQAEKCVKMMKGRFFAQRKIDAWIWSGGKIRFKTSGKDDQRGDDEVGKSESEDEQGKENGKGEGEGEEERRRKDAFGAWLDEV